MIVPSLVCLFLCASAIRIRSTGCRRGQGLLFFTLIPIVLSLIASLSDLVGAFPRRLSLCVTLASAIALCAALAADARCCLDIAGAIVWRISSLCGASQPAQTRGLAAAGYFFALFRVALLAMMALFIGELYLYLQLF
jgi:hypothetical protein